jgi:hypothetical protein
MIAENAPPGLVARAYQLARSGECEFVYEIERRLIAEGFPKVAASLSTNAELRSALRDCLKPYRRPPSGSRPR